MCLPEERDLKLRLNKKGEGSAYKLFIGTNHLKPLISDCAHGRRKTFATNRWVKSTLGPGFFMYRFKRDAIGDGWAYNQVKKIKFRNVTHQGFRSSTTFPIIVANEIFIPESG